MDISCVKWLLASHTLLIVWFSVCLHSQIFLALAASAPNTFLWRAEFGSRPLSFFLFFVFLSVSYHADTFPAPGTAPA